MSEPALPLAGVRVVEFVHMVMGPTCGLVLADLGAREIDELIGRGVAIRAFDHAFPRR